MSRNTERALPELGTPIRRRTALGLMGAAAGAAVLPLGAPQCASAAAGISSSAASSLPSFSFDFGSGPLADGYTKVTSSTVYDLALGYGFLSTAGIGDRDRGTPDPLLRDFCFGNSMDFAVDLPDGNYSVRLIAGDADASQSSLTVTAEGQTVISGVGAAPGSYIDQTFLTRVTDGQLSLRLVSTPARMNALTITPFTWEPGLSLIDDGGGSVVLKNSNVSLTIEKSTARVTAIYHNGVDPTLNYLRNGGGAYIANWSIDGVAKQQTIKTASFRIVQQTPERIEVAFTQNDPTVLPLVLEVHIAVDVDSPGLYYYTIYRYTDDMPSGLTVQQLRYSFRTDATLFTNYAVDDKRQGVAPLESELITPPLQDSTNLLPDGTVYSKYQQISNNEGSNSVFGNYGDGIGLSLIQPNKDWLAGGPTRQELTTHTATPNCQILNWQENSRHYGATDIVPQRGWEKIFGPFFLYVQEGNSMASMWADAKSKLREEVRKWPYSWIADPLYAADQRSDVTGTLRTTGRASLANAWVILADLGVDWQSSNGSYVYSAQPDARGSFTIPAVRPGTYTLHAFADGIPGELAKDGIVVSPSRPTHLGNVTWKLQPKGQMIWRIGEPNRTAGEFAIPKGIPSPVPGVEPWREYGTWLNYPIDFPNDVNFHVGRDNPATEWPYFQPMMKTPGILDQLKVPYDPAPTSRKITFDLKGNPRKDATLTLAFASIVRASLAVDCNETRVAAWNTLGSPDGDNALYRQSDRGQHSEMKVRIPATLLRKGTNVLTLSPAVVPPGNVGWTSVYANVMYDFIQLDWAAND